MEPSAMKNMPVKGYSEEIKQFSVTLFTYSKKAYEYVRESMDNCLPSVSTIQNWLNKVDSEPGFSQQALRKLEAMAAEKQEIGEKVLASLIIDEMDLKKHTDFNGKVYFQDIISKYIWL